MNREAKERANRCFFCLNRGHTASNCGKKGKAKCVRCKKSHHISVCDDGSRTKAPAAQTNFTSVGRIEVTSSGFTYLQTAQVWITGPTGLSRLTRCVLDGGSQSSFIAASLIDDLKLQAVNERELSVCAFESQSSRPSRRRLVRFNMEGFGRIPWFPSLLMRALTRFRPSQLSHKTLTSCRMPTNFNWLTLRLIRRKIFL